MAKLVRFPLKLKDGTAARSLEELREHGDLESILKHYQEGTLSRWLTVWKHEGELEKIKEIGRKFLENKQECLREIFKNLEIPLDENQFSEYCKTNLGDPSSLFDKDVYKGNDSGLSIKEKLAAFLPKDFSSEQGLENWEVTELQLDEDNVQMEFSCEKEDFYSLLKYKKDDTLYKKVASMLVSLSGLCGSKNDVVIEQKEEKKEIITSDFNPIKDTTPQKELTSEQLLNLRKLTIKDGILTFCEKNVRGEVVIPEGVKSIGHRAFNGCSSLTSVVIPKGVRKIGSYAFMGCSFLRNVVILEGVTEIGDNAFDGCRSLTSVVLPEGVRKIGRYAFLGCSFLRNVVILEGVIEIGDNAFDGCRSLDESTRQRLRSLRIMAHSKINPPRRN